MRILLVEDDALFGDGLQTGLMQHGFTVDWIKQGRQALHALRVESFDAVILDLGLPDTDGIAVLQECRTRDDRVPMLVLTARNAVDDKLQCLDGGADDYLVKPIDIREVAARLRALLRRKDGRAKSAIRHGNIELDPLAHKVVVNGRSIELSHREFEILHTLIRAPGTVMSKEQLEQTVYGWVTEVESNAIQVHLHNLRRKIGREVIRTIRGVGYTIEQQPQ
ncbi:MAG: response regulator transcription factor [Gammaproteobacteria bacterium]|nr:response regulator transcription factor [Gammaproteobacteria bacterium]